MDTPISTPLPNLGCFLALVLSSFQQQCLQLFLGELHLGYWTMVKDSQKCQGITSRRWPLSHH